MSSLKYWVWLSSAKGIKADKIEKLINHFGSPENIYATKKADLAGLGILSKREEEALSDKRLDRADKILINCDRMHIRILTITDSDYPDRLKNIYAPPAVLYVCGQMPHFDDEVAVAVVGTRKATAYGRVAASELAYNLAKGGALVVSGMARGIDSAANMGAIRAGRPTVAVLGCGSDICYPRENRQLKLDIEATGATITEYPPGTEPYRENFPERNRIISGLCLATVVVEAPNRSGSLITADLANEQGRDVFVVPGNIDNAQYQGSNSLIKDGARLITSADDILSEYRELFPHKILSMPEKIVKDSVLSYEERTPVKAAYEKREEGTKTKEHKMPDGLSESGKKIFEALSHGEKHIDKLIEETGMTAGEMLSALTMLEIIKVVRQKPGKIFEIID